MEVDVDNNELVATAELREYFIGASETFGNGHAFMDQFDGDRFSEE